MVRKSLAFGIPLLAGVALSSCSRAVPLGSGYYQPILDSTEVEVIDANDFDREEMTRLLNDYEIISRFDVTVIVGGDYDAALAKELEKAKTRTLAAGGRTLMYTENSELVAVIKRDAHFAGSSEGIVMYVMQRIEAVTEPAVATPVSDPPAVPKQPVPDPPTVPKQPVGRTPPAVSNTPDVFEALDAKSLSPEQREVWRMEEAYQQYWKDGDVERYMTLWHDNFIGWPDGSGQPTRKDGIRRSFQQYVADGWTMTELRVEAVQRFGGIAVTHYVASGVSRDGSESWTRKITHTWIRIGNTWQIIGGMSAPTKRP